MRGLCRGEAGPMWAQGQWPHCRVALSGSRPRGRHGLPSGAGQVPTRRRRHRRRLSRAGTAGTGAAGGKLLAKGIRWPARARGGAHPRGAEAQKQSREKACGLYKLSSRAAGPQGPLRASCWWPPTPTSLPGPAPETAPPRLGSAHPPSRPVRKQ